MPEEVMLIKDLTAEQCANGIRGMVSKISMTGESHTQLNELLDRMVELGTDQTTADIVEAVEEVLAT